MSVFGNIVRESRYIDNKVYVSFDEENYRRLELKLKEQEQEIERLTKQNKALNEMYELTKKEYIRLNNIINKGKIYCEDVIQEHENGEYNVSTTQLVIEEHKKNIMSLLNILNGDLENYWRSDKE